MKRRPPVLYSLGGALMGYNCPSGQQEDSSPWWQAMALHRFIVELLFIYVVLYNCVISLSLCIYIIINYH